MLTSYRTLLIIAISIVCLGGAFWCYLEYNQQTFEKSLPVSKPEPQTSKGEGFQMPTAQEVTENSDLEKAPERFADQQDTSLNEMNLPDTEKQGEVSENPLIEDVQVLEWATEAPPTEVLEHLWQDLNTSPINANELSPAEYEAYYRDQLKKEYGDLPEIDVYVKLHRRIFTERKPCTLDELLQFNELSAFFYPSPENELGVQELKDFRDRLGGDVIVLPAEDISIEE